MDQQEARAALRTLVTEGWLIGVEVFGTDQCCQHGDHVDCDSTGYGLCDVFGPNSIGSDCNRANRWLMRPTDSLLEDDLVAAINDEHAFKGPGNGWDKRPLVEQFDDVLDRLKEHLLGPARP